MGKIAIIGISGESIFLNVDHFPKPSETIQAKKSHIEPGGKGYNQAVACKKMECDVSYLTKVGNDNYGKYCYNYTKKLGINSFFKKSINTPTTIATILTDNFGENQVIVSLNSSTELTKEDLFDFIDEIRTSDILLIQYEIDHEILKEAIKIAKESNTYVILNPAPAVYDDLELLESANLITPNFIETKKLYKLDEKITPSELGEILSKKIRVEAVITLGSNGALHVKQGYYKYYPSIKVDAVDTTGAGDIFNAGLATMISKNKSVEEAIEYANIAAALSVTKKYVLDSIPTNDEILKKLEEIKNESK